MNNSSLVAKNTSLALKGQKVTGMRIAIVAGNSDLDVSDGLVKLFRSNGIMCWTERDMLPGSDRTLAIKTAYNEADFILVLLLKTSVARQGEFQRQVRMAVDANGVMPESGIKVMPVRLNDCDLPWELKKLYYIDANQPDAMKRLVLAWAKEWHRRDVAKDWPDLDYQSYWV